MAIPLLVAGAAVSAVSQSASANSQANAAELDATYKRQQADEEDRRSRVKAEDLAREGQQVEGSQVAAFAGGGVEMSGTPLLALEETHARVGRDILEMQKEASFRSDQLRKGANLSDDFASTRRLTGDIGAAGSILSAAGSYAKSRV